MKDQLKKKDSEMSSRSEAIIQERENIVNEIIENLLNPPVKCTDFMTDDDILSNTQWKVDQLAWARMNPYPFWPCMVTPDPEPPQLYKKVQIHSKSRTLMIHVHFFNDFGQHRWISADNLMPFLGHKMFWMVSERFIERNRKKKSKIEAALQIKSSLNKWQLAVAEAMDVMEDLDTSSLDLFKPSNTNPPIPKNNHGVKRKRGFGEDHSKKQNQSNNSLNHDDNYPDDDDMDDSKSDLSSKELKKKKTIQKQTVKKKPKLPNPDYQVYFQRNQMVFQQWHPNETDETIKKYCEDTWKLLTKKEKKKYRGVYNSHL